MSRELKSSSYPDLDKLVRSDWLPNLVAIIRAYPSLKPLLPDLLELRLIIDANMVWGELRWRLKPKLKPDSRSALHEAVDAGFVILFAPEQLKKEIEEHYGDIARQSKKAPADVMREWASFQKHIHFYSPKQRPSYKDKYADIDDFPYLATWIELDARAIYTKDRHLKAMGAPVLSVLIDTRLRRYARATAVQLAARLGSSLAIFIGLEQLGLIFKLLARTARQLPPVVWVALGGLAVICIANPKFRAKMKRGWQNLARSRPVAELGEMLWNLMQQVDELAEAASGDYEFIQSVLPPERKRPLILRARAVCVAAGSPLTLSEIERRIRLGGYESLSKSFKHYLRRVLRGDSSFEEITPGKWRIQPGRSC